jgi:outer membrane protein assembly factor BamD (BamD/ComL family)
MTDTTPAARYPLEDRELVAEAPGLRVQVLTVGPGQCVPWHRHTEITDTFFCLDGPMLVEIYFPFIALSAESEAELFVQTESGRKQHAANGKALAQPFDTSVPGTMKLTTRPSDAAAGKAGEGYTEVLIVGDRFASEPLDDGRFTFSVPIALDDLPEVSLVDEEPQKGEGAFKLAVRGGEKVYMGFRYKQPDGKENWITRAAVLKSDAFFEVMDRRFREVVEGAYVGEKAYFRLVHRGRDVSKENDTVAIQLKASSGAARTLKLVETYPHGGEFRGLVKFHYASGQAGDIADPNVLRVKYGDTVTITYADPNGDAKVERQLVIFKGADGAVTPFTKRFKDDDIALHTQFRLAEAYFELAKKHRKMGRDLVKQGEEEQGLELQRMARGEMSQAKKLLEEAIRDFPNVAEVRAQAEYLLANLAMERGTLTTDPEAKKKEYAEALRRFDEIVLSHPDSEYAPQAQFKKALTFEKMNRFDDASEEYVKLSYRYPDHELVAETIARLGNYFLIRGQAKEKAAKEIEDPVAREKEMMTVRKTYKTAGEVFGRMAPRFPGHKLAGKTTVISGKCFIRASAYEKAIKSFNRVIDNPDQDKDLRAEAMYWAGHAHMTVATEDQATSTESSYKQAYRMFKRLTWDFPESTWAKYARRRLTEEALATIDEGGGN